MEEDSSSAPRRNIPPGRSFASANWRVKDDTPRADPQPQTRNQQSFNQNRAGDGGRPSEANVPETRLYVGNLLYDAQRSDVEALFTSHGFQITGISMSIDPFTNRNRSYAFVDFETVEEAQRAMAELNGQELLGRAVKINPGMRKEAGAPVSQNRGPSFDGQRRGGDRAGGRMNLQDYADNGLNQGSNGYNRSQNSPRPENPTRLYVGNLPNFEPQELAEAAIRELFVGFQPKSVSRLIAPHESKAEEPGNHHYCFVDFETPDEADQALEALAGKEAPWGGEMRINKARDNRQKRQYGERREGYTRPSGGANPGAAGTWR